MGPDPNAIYPNANIKQVVYIKNVVTHPDIIVGEYTYYDDVGGAKLFEDHVTHHCVFDYPTEAIEYSKRSNGKIHCQCPKEENL